MYHVCPSVYARGGIHRDDSGSQLWPLRRIGLRVGLVGRLLATHTHMALFDVFGDFTCLNAWSVAKEKGFKRVLEVLKKHDGRIEY